MILTYCYFKSYLLHEPLSHKIPLEISIDKEDA